MKMTHFARSILAVAAMLVAAPALAQTYSPGLQTQDTNPLPVKSMCYTAGVWAACPASSGGSGTATPTGTAGAPNASVVSVQGVSGGTPQNVTVASALPAGANAIGSITNSAFGISGSLPTGANTIGAISNTGFAVTSALPAGANAIGSITNTGFAVNAALPTGANTIGAISAINGALPTGANTIGRMLPAVDNTGTGSASFAVLTAVGSGVVVKNSPGNLFGLNVVTGATAGYVLVFNAVAVPADGTVTPTKCYVLAASSSLDLNLRAVPTYFPVGISVAFSSTGCFTKTSSATAFISGDYK